MLPSMHSEEFKYYEGHSKINENVGPMSTRHSKW